MGSTIGKELETFDGVVTFFMDLKISDVAKPGDVKLDFTVKTQACNQKQCAAPVENQLGLDVMILPERKASALPRHAEIFNTDDK